MEKKETSLQDLVTPLDCKELVLETVAKHPELKASLEEIVKSFRLQLNRSNRKDTNRAVEKIRIDPGSGWCILQSQSFQTPRAVYNVEFCHDGTIYLHGKNASLTLKPGQIHSFLVLETADQYSSSKSKIQLFIRLSQPLQVQKSVLDCLLVTPTPLKKSTLLETRITNPPPNDKNIVGQDINGFPLDVWKSILSIMGMEALITEPSLSVFRSSVNRTYVKCFFGVNSGLLFPTQVGIVFIQKPLLFLPLENIKRIELGREGSVSGRTFDLNIFNKDDSVHQFSMIESAELGSLANYVSEMQTNQDSDKNDLSSTKEHGSDPKRPEEEADSEYEDEESSESDSDQSGDIDSDDMEMKSDVEHENAEEDENVVAMRITRSGALNMPLKPQPEKRKHEDTLQKGDGLSLDDAKHKTVATDMVLTNPANNNSTDLKKPKLSNVDNNDTATESEGDEACAY